jgi:site-specific DNA-cytosine methylase
MNNEIKYAGIVPLIGGMMFGAEKATGKKPEYILSYPPFAGNDSMLMDYWKEVPYHVIDPETNTVENTLSNVDFVSALCPCAGLSQLNNGKNRGANATQNDWMYKTAEFVLEGMQPKVFWGENAPGLFNPVGEPVAERLREIGEKNGYSMSLLKTSTMLHGIPQNRVRSFYFFWKSETAPILNWYNVEMPTLEEYLHRIDEMVSPEDKLEKALELQSDPLYIWLKQEFGDWRGFMKEKKGSMMDVMINSGKPDEYIEWVKTNYPDHEKKAAHALYKRRNGMGFWDSSPFLPSDYTGAFTGARMNAIHPTDDRVLTRRELMHFMGLPSNMIVPTQDHMGRVFQNVPSSTAADWTREVIKFINGELEMSEHSFIKQDNLSQKITVPSRVKSAPLF